MSRLAVINGKLIDVSQGVVETRNLFLKNGVLVGLGYVADEKEDDQEVIDLDKAHLFPAPCNLGLNSLEISDLSMKHLGMLGVASLMFWPTETSPLDTVSDFNDVFNRYKDMSLDYYGCAALTVDGHSLTDLVGLSRAGAVGFYQDAASVDLDVFEEALPVLVQLDMPLFLDTSQMAHVEVEVLSSVIDVVKECPGVKLHVMSVQSTESIALLREAHTQNIQITAAVNIPDIQRLSVTDRQVFIDALNDGTFSALIHTGDGGTVVTLIDTAMKEFGLDAVTVAKLVGINILVLLGKKTALFNLQSRPSFLALSMDSSGQTNSELVKLFVNGIPLEIGV